MDDNTLASLGFALAPGVLDGPEQAVLRPLFDGLDRAGRRGLLSDDRVSALAHSPKLLNLVRPHLPGKPIAVRALAFDKSQAVNWLVPWHQDLTIAVREQIAIPGFGPWSVKDGVPHVQPPVEWLELMLAVRLHLDDADETNGALRVLPGAHLLGRLSPAQIQTLRQTRPEHLCRARAGDALLMRPLLPHASSRSLTPRSRRVLHLEYAARPLPGGLSWHETL
jgi:ectoine hydroxylase-related dioxygenase (phytanoyl-CoA dioxygenase family)